MILITGGAYQGKSAFAKELKKRRGGTDAPVIIENIHAVIARAIREGRDPYTEIEKLAGTNPDAIFTVNELGCGIVPMEAFDREWRETTGRICCRLAEQAEEVYRVTCGIATRLK